MRNLNFKVAILVTSLVVAGCGGGGGGGGSGGGNSGGSGYCVGSFLGGDTTWSCNNCSGLDPLDDNDDFSPSIDDDSGSYTSFGISPGGGQVTVTAIAPSGTTFPAGVDAGALMRFPSGSFTNVGVRFNTYNNSTPVDSQAGGATTAVGNVPGAGSDTYYEITPSGGFTKLEAVITLSGNPDRADFRLYEFCGDK